MRVGPAKAGDDHFAAGFFAVFFAHEQKVRRIQHPNTAIADGNAGRDVQAVSEYRDLVGAPVTIGVLEDFHAIAARSGGFARILDALGNPNAPAIVERHRNGIHDVRFAGNRLDRETSRDDHLLNGFVRRVRLVRCPLLSMGNDFVSVGEKQAGGPQKE